MIHKQLKFGNNYSFFPFYINLIIKGKKNSNLFIENIPKFKKIINILNKKSKNIIFKKFYLTIFSKFKKVI